MTALQGALLGLLQGIAEFLPISSSGHLAVAQHLFGLNDVPLLYDVALHIATLAAVFLFFRKRIGGLFVTLWKWITRKTTDADSENLSMIVAVLVGTVCTGLLGVVIEKFILNSLGASATLKLISACFLLTAVLLVISERLATRLSAKGSGHAPSLREGLIVGIAQGIGVLPGLSRSGVTISAALAAGVDRQKAGEFSFILSIPAILGAFILELKDADTLMSAVAPLPLLIGMAVAFASGFLALRFLVGLIQRGRLSWFALYLVPLGVAGLLFL